MTQQLRNMDMLIEPIALEEGVVLIAEVVLNSIDNEGIDVSYEEWMAELEAAFQQFCEENQDIGDSDDSDSEEVNSGDSGNSGDSEMN